ncbi:MAG: hypothetical protein DYG94_09780 [Leptolyngbya sp. PLA3]|nr:MAG: hypothetical protein EDM82_07915 [Cyanobacteria bacterium CYA]MCE7969019.1 hypothetical protein [Leptolyngbya sp. PL-A3]
MSHDLLQPQYILPLVGLSVSGIAIAGSIAWDMARSRERTRQLEATRRTVAAAVAEGTMTADEAERIVSDASRSSRRCGWRCRRH